jgi:outer membrane protein
MKASKNVKTHLIILLFLVLTAVLPVAAEETVPMTLEQALDIAFEKSPSIQEAALQLEVSERNLKAQQAGLKSQFNLTVTPLDINNSRVFNELTSSYNTQEQTKSEAQFSVTQPIKWTDGTLSIIQKFNWQEASSAYTGSVKESYYSNSLYLKLNQPLFTYNRTKVRTDELKLNLENARLNYAIQKLQIENQVTQQFLNLFYLLEGIEIAREELKNSTESYNIIESKVDAGISAKEELYQADLTRANSQSSVQSQQMQYENALDSFKILLGIPFERKIKVVAELQKSLVDVKLAHAVDHGLKYRMELRQRDIKIQNALYDLIEAKAENEFKATLDVSFGLTGTGKKMGDIYKSPNNDKLIAISFNIPIFDWGKKKHHVAASKAQVETSRLAARNEKRNIEYEIRQAFRNLYLQKTQIEIAEKNVNNARLTYEINLERYKSGDLSSKDMQFYQLQLSEEQLKRVQALINYKMALLDLKIRTLWDFEKNESIINNDQKQ